MASGNVYHGFFNKAIIGAEVFENDIFEAVRQENRDLAGQAIGESVLDSGGVGLTITASADALNDRKATIVGAGLTTINEDGYLVIAGNTSPLKTFTDGARTPTVQDPAWWIDLPYENAASTSYNVYVAQTRYPIDVGIARGGTPRGYNRWVDAPGISVQPDTIVDTSTELRLEVEANLTALGIQDWLTGNTEDPSWSFDCIVYLDVDQTGVQIATDDPDVAIALTAKLTKKTVGTGWVVDLAGLGDGYLGQSVPDTDPTHYQVVVLGPVITTTDFDANTAYTHVGIINSDPVETFDVSGQKVVTQFSDFSTYGIDHDPTTGHHKFIRMTDDVGPGATAGSDQHAWVEPESEGFRFAHDATVTAQPMMVLDEYLHNHGVPRSEGFAGLDAYYNGVVTGDSTLPYYSSWRGNSLAVPKQTAASENRGQQEVSVMSFGDTVADIIPLPGSTAFTHWGPTPSSGMFASVTDAVVNPSLLTNGADATLYAMANSHAVDRNLNASIAISVDPSSATTVRETDITFSTVQDGAVLVNDVSTRVYLENAISGTDRHVGMHIESIIGVPTGHTSILGTHGLLIEGLGGLGGVKLEGAPYEFDSDHPIIINGTTLEWRLWLTPMDIFKYAHDNEQIAGSGTMGYHPYDTGVQEPAVYLNSDAAGRSDFKIPIRLPGNAVIDQFEIWGRRDDVATVLDFSFAEIEPGTSTLSVAGTGYVFTDTSGSIVKETNNPSTFSLPHTADRMTVLILTMGNLGAGIDSVSCYGILLSGHLTQVESAGVLTS